MRKAFFALTLIFGAVAALPAEAAGFLQDLFSSPERPAPTVYQYAPTQPQMRFVYDDGLRVSRRPHVSTKSQRARHLAHQRRIEKKKAATLRWKRRTRDRFMALASVKIRVLRTAAALQPALCCKNGEDPSKLIHSDMTLRVGDAYMTPNGLRVYRGRGAGVRESAAFVDYRKAGPGQDLKARLAALEDHRSHYAQANHPRFDPAPRLHQVSTSAPPKAIAVPPSVSSRYVTSGARMTGMLSLASHASTGGPVQRTALDPRGRVIRIVGP